jgi:hypothetical protein
VKKIIIIAVVFVIAATAVLIPAAAWAGEAQLTEKQKSVITSVAKMYYSKEQVSFYNNRVFIRDSEDWIVTFKVDRHRATDIQLMPGCENFGAFMFFMSVTMHLERPDGLFGGNVVAWPINGGAR